MADGVEFKFPDLHNLIDRMKHLDNKVQSTIARRATLKGINVIRDQARANAQRVDDPKTPNNIATNITTQYASKLSRMQRGAAYRLGVRGGAQSQKGLEPEPTHTATGRKRKQWGGDTFYWRFLEFGTSKMAAKPFMRPALFQKGNEAMRVAMEEALRLIGQEATKGK